MSDTPFKLDQSTGAVPDMGEMNASDMKGMLNAKKVIDSGKNLPSVTIFEDIDFRGVKADTTNGWKDLGSFWRNRISSIKIDAGTWRFYEGVGYTGNFRDLGPGSYRWVCDEGLANDRICSFRPL